MSLTLERDFTGLPDGAFPADYGVGILNSEGGTDSILEETAPSLYYYIESGQGVFKYTEQMVGPATYRRGFVSSPGLLEGKDAKVSIQFSDPLRNFDEALEEVWVQIGLGVRGKEKTLEWVGGLLESHWVKTTGWGPKFRLAVVETKGTVSTALESITNERAYLEKNELMVQAVGPIVTVAFNGVEILEAESDFRGEDSIALWIRTTVNNGAAITPIPLLLLIVGESLSSGRDYSIREIPGNFVEPPFDGAHFYNFPIKELVDEGSLIQVTRNTWRFTREVVIDRPEEYIRFAASEGAVIIAHRQTLVDAHVQTCKFIYGR